MLEIDTLALEMNVFQRLPNRTYVKMFASHSYPPLKRGVSRCGYPKGVCAQQCVFFFELRGL